MEYTGKIFLATTAAFVFISSALIVGAAETFNTGGASGQQYWDTHFGTPGGGGGGGGAAGLPGSREFTREEIMAIIEAIKNKEFKNPAFIQALFSFLMDNPDLAAKSSSTDAKEPDLADLYNYVKAKYGDKYPDIVNSIRKEDITDPAPVKSSETQESYRDSYNKALLQVSAKSVPVSVGNAAKSPSDPVSPVKMVDGTAVIGNSNPGTAVVGKKAAEAVAVRQKNSAQTASSKNIFQQAIDYVGSSINRAFNSIGSKISSLIPSGTGSQPKTVDSKTNVKVLGNPKPETVSIGGSKYKPTQNPDTNYKPTQVLNTDYKPTQTVNTDYKPTQYPNTDYKPTRELNTDYKPTQTVNTDYKPTQYPNTDYKPTRELNTDFKPTYYPAGYDEETGVAVLGGDTTPTYMPAPSGSFSAGFDAAPTSANENSNRNFFSPVSDAYWAVANWMQQFFNF